MSSGFVLRRSEKLGIEKFPKDRWLEAYGCSFVGATLQITFCNRLKIL